MKPLKLTMTAFGSYAEKTEIDFTKLGNGLYVITGVTGAGKTTIFDAIVYALYGEASSSNRTNCRSAKSFHSDYVGYDIATEVSLDFEVKGKKYTINRCINFRKKQKNGMTEKQTLNLKNGKVIEGKAEVNKKIKEILGFSKEQFCQIIMLAQGEFRKFIDANSVERGEILGVLFGTEQYKKVQETYKALYTLCNQRKNEIEKDIKRTMESLKLPEDMIEEERAKYNSANSDFMPNLEELIKTDRQTCFELSNEKEKLKEEKDKNVEILEKSKLQNQMLSQKEDAEKEYQNILSKDAYYKELKEKLIRNQDALQEVYPIDEQKKKLEKDISIKNSEIEKTKEELAKTDIEFEQYKIEKENNRILELHNDELKKKINHIHEILPDYKKQTLLKNDIRNGKIDLDKKNKEITKLEKELADLKEKMQANQSELQQLGDTETKLIKAKHTLEDAEDNLKKINMAEEKYNDILEIEDKIEFLMDSIEDANVDYSVKLNTYNSLNLQFMDGQSVRLREKLNQEINKNGYANCPVCHVIHKERISENESDNHVPSEEELKQAKSIWEESGENLNCLQNELDNKKISIQEKQNNLIENLSEMMAVDSWEQFVQNSLFDTLKRTIHSQYDEAKKQLVELEEKNKNAKELKQKIEDDNSLLINKDKELIDIRTSVSLIANDIKNFENSLQELSKKLDQYESEIDANVDLNKIEKEIHKNIETIQKAEKDFQMISDKKLSLQSALKEKESDLNKLNQDCSEVISRFQNALQDYRFENENMYQEYLNIFEENPMHRKSALLEKQKEIQKYYDDLKEKKNTLDTLKNQTKDFVKSDISMLETQLDELKNAYNSTEKKLEDARVFLDNHTGIIDKLQELDKKSENTIKKCEQVQKMHQIINATTSADGGKITFERWVMSKTFKQVIAHATARLELMSGGKLNLEHDMNNSSGKNKSAGLEINVVDNVTGTVREIGSVSGGEAFQISMAFALGLSDVVQNRSGNVRIDSMFIDEGFGSLDDCVLTRAIETLRDIHVDQIGIISHVNNLEDMIDKKIRVESTNRGSIIKMIV